MPSTLPFPPLRPSSGSLHGAVNFLSLMVKTHSLSETVRGGNDELGVKADVDGVDGIFSRSPGVRIMGPLQSLLLRLLPPLPELVERSIAALYCDWRKTNPEAPESDSEHSESPHEEEIEKKIRTRNMVSRRLFPFCVFCSSAAVCVVAQVD